MGFVPDAHFISLSKSLRHSGLFITESISMNREQASMHSDLTLSFWQQLVRFARSFYEERTLLMISILMVTNFSGR